MLCLIRVKATAPRSLTRSLAYPLAHARTHSRTQSLKSSLTQSITHSFAHSVNHSLTRPPTHPPTGNDATAATLGDCNFATDYKALLEVMKGTYSKYISKIFHLFLNSFFGLMHAVLFSM